MPQFSISYDPRKKMYTARSDAKTSVEFSRAVFALGVGNWLKMAREVCRRAPCSDPVLAVHGMDPADVMYLGAHMRAFDSMAVRSGGGAAVPVYPLLSWDTDTGPCFTCEVEHPLARPAPEYPASPAQTRKLALVVFQTHRDPVHVPAALRERYSAVVRYTLCTEWRAAGGDVVAGIGRCVALLEDHLAHDPCGGIAVVSTLEPAHSFDVGVHIKPWDGYVVDVLEESGAGLAVRHVL